MFMGFCLQKLYIHGLVKIDTWISLSCYMDLPKLLHAFLKLLYGFLKVALCFYHPLSNKTKLTFDQNLKACWSFCFESTQCLGSVVPLAMFYVVVIFHCKYAFHTLHCIMSIVLMSSVLFSHRHRYCHRHHHMYLEKRVGKYLVARSLYCSPGKTSAGQRQHSSHLKQSSLQL